MNTALEALLPLVVKSTLLLALGAAGLWMLRGTSAQIRHALLVATFLGLLFLPLTLRYGPTLELALLPPLAANEVASSFPASDEESSPEESREGHGPDQPVPSTSVASTPGDQEPAVASMRGPAATPASGMQAFAAGSARFHVLFWVWISGACAVLSSLGVGLLRVRRMHAAARPVESGPWLAELEQRRAQLGIRRPVELLASSSISTPLTFGWRRPVVLVPQGFASWSAGCRRDTLLHELGHIERLDWPVQLIVRLACALYWCHPGVWAAARRLALESEKACDEGVLHFGSQATEYARHLLELAQRIRSPQIQSAAPGSAGLGGLGGSGGGALIAMSGATSLSSRIHTILDPNNRSRVMKPSIHLSIYLAVLALGAPLAASSFVPALPASASPVQERAAVVAAAQSSEAVLFHPEPQAAFRARWQWALEHAAGHAKNGEVVIGYSVLGRPGSHSYSNHGEEADELLSERLFGRGEGRRQWEALRAADHTADDSAEHSEAGERHELALLFGMQLDGSRPRLTKVRTLTIWSPYEDQRPILWLGSVEDADSIQHARALYQASRELGTKKGLLSAIALHGRAELVVPELESFLREDPEPKLRSQAAFWLSQQDVDERVAPLLMSAARNDGSKKVREQSIFAVSQLQEDLAAALLVQLSNEGESEDAREKALFWLAQTSKEVALATYRDILLRDPSTKMAKKIAFNLSQLGELGTPVLIDTLHNDTRMEVRKDALFWLAQADTEKTQVEIRKLLLGEEGTPLVKHAIFVLSQLKETGVPLLVETLRHDTRTSVRKEALFWLAQTDAHSTQVEIEQLMLVDTDAKLLEHAVFVLTQLPTEYSLPALEEVARTHHLKKVRKQAIFWLGQEDGERVGQFLDEMLQVETDLDLLKAIVFAFHNMSPTHGGARLEQAATSHPMPEVRKHARFWIDQK